MPRYRIKIKRNALGTPRFMFAHWIGKNGGKGRIFFVGECWPSKGYWILCFIHDDVLYRVWTSGISDSEVRAWVRWSQSPKFREDARNGKSFSSNPQAACGGIPLGIRSRSCLRKNSEGYGEIVHQGELYWWSTPSGCVLQTYPVQEFLQERSHLSLFTLI